MENRILVIADDFFGDNGEVASHFSELLLCLASEVYTAEDYIRDYNEFKSLAL